MSGPGEAKTVRNFAVLIVGTLLACGMAACAYEDDGDPKPAAAGQSHGAAPAVPTKDPGVLGAEASNYAELHRRLADTTGSVLLTDAGPADGPGVGFRKAAMVKTAGPYTVTATCVGTRGAQIFVSQDGAEPVSLDVDCSGVLSKVVVLQRGYVGTQLTRHDPTGAWTGAVAGIKITAPRG
jgi:hypothetical protein